VSIVTKVIDAIRKFGTSAIYSLIGTAKLNIGRKADLRHRQERVGTGHRAAVGHF
jgi:hypothetical protein